MPEDDYPDRPFEDDETTRVEHGQARSRMRARLRGLPALDLSVGNPEVSHVVPSLGWVDDPAAANQ
jgi:hypothetical protein